MTATTPRLKFSQWEMKGVPLRLERSAPRMEKNQCVLVRRDTREKVFVSLDELETAIPAQLEACAGPVPACPREPREAHLGCHHHG